MDNSPEDDNDVRRLAAEAKYWADRATRLVHLAIGLTFFSLIVGAWVLYMWTFSR